MQQDKLDSVLLILASHMETKVASADIWIQEPLPLPTVQPYP